MSLDETRAYDMTELSKAPLGRVPPPEGPETKVIARTLLVSPTNGPLAGETLHYALDLVNFDYRTWHEYEWGNWVAVDALLYAAFRGVANVSIWVPLHGYVVGNIVVSTETGLAYECLVAHTSNATSIMPDIASGKWLETIIGDSYTKDQADARFVDVAGDTMIGALTLFGDPTSPQHAADKQYVDLLDANQKTYIDAANAAQDSALTTQLGLYMPKTGGTFTGAISWATAPTTGNHLTNKTYVDLKDSTQKTYIDTQDAGRVLKTGDVMTGPLTLPGDPSANLHAAPKQYVDAMAGEANNRMRWRGAWAAGTYVANDVVTDTGYLFVAKQTTTQKPYTGKPPAPTQWDILAGGGGGSSVVVSATAPVGPVQGDMWFSTVEPVGLFVWYDDGSGAQWVQTNGGAGTACLPLTGGTLSGALTVSSVNPANPELRFLEPDQTDPAGRFMFQGSGGNFIFWRFAGAGWTSAQQVWRYVGITNTLELSVPTVLAAELQGTTAKFGNVYVGANPIGGAAPSHISAASGQTLGLRGGIDTNNMVQFVDSANVQVARIDTAGTVASVANTIITREKGDARYLNATGGDVTGTLKVTNAAPQLQFDETDQAGAPGLYRFILNGDAFYLNKNTSANNDFATGDYIWSALASGEFRTYPNTQLATVGGNVEIGHATLATMKFMRSSSNNYIDMLASTSFVFRSNGVAWASLTSVAGWTAGSDAKLKENVTPISYGLDAVLAMKPVEFDWLDGGAHDIGFIAQDMADVVPEVIDDVDDDNDEQTTTLHMRKDALTAVLVKAVQELTARVAELEARL
jgi:hypothetical protein